MKIIGDAGSDDLIVMIHKNELAKFMGFYSEFDVRNKNISLKPGSIINVGECYKKAQEALSLHENAQQAAKQLKNTAMKFLSFFEKPE